MTGTRTRQLQGRSSSPVRQQGKQVYIFSSVRNSSVNAFTSDSTAANLPLAYAPWQSSIDTAPTGGLADPVMAAIQRDGFFLVNARSSSKIRFGRPLVAPSRHKHPMRSGELAHKCSD
jgi:hypothetical protein